MELIYWYLDASLKCVALAAARPVLFLMVISHPVAIHLLDFSRWMHQLGVMEAGLLKNKAKTVVCFSLIFSCNI